MASRMTRRDLAAVVAVPVLLAAEQPQPRGGANENSQLVQVQMKQNHEALAAFDVPMDTEPAVHFRA